LLKPGSTVYAIDKNGAALQTIAEHVSGVVVEKLTLDLIDRKIPVADLDGILMANTLHYIRDKASFLNYLASLLKQHGVLLIAEYDTSKANPWVPYPVSFESLSAMLTNTEFGRISKIGEHPSVYRKENIYAAMLEKQGA